MNLCLVRTPAWCKYCLQILLKLWISAKSKRTRSNCEDRYRMKLIMFSVFSVQCGSLYEGCKPTAGSSSTLHGPF